MTTYPQRSVNPPIAPDSQPFPVARAKNSAQMAYDGRVLMELAQQLKDPVEVLREYGYIGENAFNFVASQMFQNDLKRVIEEMSQGMSFRVRARMMADDVLDSAYGIAMDMGGSEAVRLEAGKWIAKMGDLEPKDKNGGQNQAFVLQIDMRG